MDLRIFALVVILFAQAVLSDDDRSFQNPCGSKTSCHECIQTRKCSWCLAPEFGDRARCFLSELTSTATCAEEYVFNPDNTESIPPEYNKELSRAEGGSMSGSGSSGGSGHFGSSGSSGSSGSYGESIVQIAPQRVDLKLRMNEMHKLKVRYSQAVDYPVDLYYLMDLSKSMEDDKEKLSDLGNLLSDTMRNLTSNFRLGFGSFVDKVLMPYVSTVPKKLISPCDKCEAPYGFKNHLRLSTNTTTFAEEVRRAAVSGNLDAPEGGFDAIMQAVVCRDQIGWRDQARRLLVFSTDAGFHYAGDGKLGGVITPNDGECHLDGEFYTHSSILDYPSISQVNYKVKENAINVIFAVTHQQHEVYKKLSEHIEGSSSAILQEDSSNVVDLVKDEYSKISSTVEMKDNANSAIKITYYSKCKGDSRIETNKCDGLKVGDIVSFDAEIKVTSCPTNPRDWNQVFQIYPVGINESMTVNLEMLCDCACEHSGHPAYKEKSEMCSFQGTSTCGICDCNDQHFGRKCECSNLDLHSEENSGCQPFSSDNTTIGGSECSGRGNCVCNQCECERRAQPEEIISGKFCECDNFSCDRHMGLLCSGPEKGICTCGTCTCQPGWIGDACDCRASNATCIAPNSQAESTVCSGHGTCECGACRCNSNEEGRFSGKFCEKCPTCSGRCAEFKDCVQCQMYKTGPLDEETCATNCTLFTPVGLISVHPYDENDEYLCTYYDEDDCRFQFVYSEIDEKVTVKAQQERECPPKVFMLGIVLGVIGFIVLIGLAMLLLWKLLTTIHDQREFANFEKERIAAKWDTGENPIYKQATSTFKNPTYAGK